MIPRRALLLLCILAILPAAALALEAEPFITEGVYGPLFLTSPPGDVQRLFILEQRGRIMIHKNGAVQETPFLNLIGQISYGGERGLLGLAFHPDYAENGEFYLDLTRSRNDSLFTQILRYQVSNDPDLADTGSEELLLEIYQPFSNHNGGMIAFGPDGYLYIGMGDGGSGGDPQNNAQNDQSLLGKMLRIDVDGDSPYGIPSDNPFIGQPARDEIWAKGLRNPWRFSFDRDTGDLWIGDVGQGSWEEVDYQPAASPGGENYGWRIMEGVHCFNPPMNCDDTGLSYPVYEYVNGANCSITGGYLYRGPQAPELLGLYVFGDYCSGRVWALDPSDYSATQIFSNLGSISSFGEDQLGNVYVIDSGGTIYKLVSDATGATEFPGQDGVLRLASASPNPFRGQTELRLSLGEGGPLEVAIYGVSGRRLRQLHSGSAPGGEVTLRWDGRDDAGRGLASGVYYLRAETSRERISAPLTLLR